MQRTAIITTCTAGMLTDAAASSAIGRVRLMQLISPALPIGAFTYSQGLEWAVEAGWVTDIDSLSDWLGGLLDDAQVYLEIPVLCRLYDACSADDPAMLQYWGQRLFASRETRELREEERGRARALVSLLTDLGLEEARDWREPLLTCQAAPFALAAQRWNVSREDCALGYAWSWLESQVAAAIKLIPLGQTAGQRVQLELSTRLPQVVAQGMAVQDADIGAAAPALAIASAAHETQYTRLFRS